MKNPYLEKYNKENLKKPLKGCAIGCLSVLSVLIIALLVTGYFCILHRYPMQKGMIGENSVSIYRVGIPVSNGTFELRIDGKTALEFDCGLDPLCILDAHDVEIREIDDHKAQVECYNDDFVLKMEIDLEGDAPNVVWWLESDIAEETIRLNERNHDYPPVRAVDSSLTLTHRYY